MRQANAKGRKSALNNFMRDGSLEPKFAFVQKTFPRSGALVESIVMTEGRLAAGSLTPSRALVRSFSARAALSFRRKARAELNGARR
jgi:hypothetical protein